MAYTLGDIRTLVRDVLNESTETFFTNDELTRWIGDVTLDVSGLLKCVEATTTISLTIGQKDYALPTDSIEAQHVQVQATGKGLIKITPSSAGHHALDDGTETDPQRWYEWNRRLYVEPIPTVAMDGKNLEIFYAREETDVTVLASYTQSLVVQGVLIKAKMKDRLFPEASALYADYINGIAFRRGDVYQRSPQTEEDLRINRTASSE